jgi:5-methylcytosine-specific restriction endonuclease McrA
MGYSSLFDFCVRRLGYCEGTAVRRIKAARCIRDIPEAYDALASGKVSLTNLARISGIITVNNIDEILSAIAGASKREVELLVSRHNPRSAIRDSVKPVYVKTVLKVSGGSAARGDKDGHPKSGKKSTVTGDGKKPATGITTGSTAGGAGTERCVVLERRFKVQFGVDQGFIDKLERVRSLLSSRQHGKLEFEELFEILLDEYIDRHSPEGRLGRRKEKMRRRGKQAKGSGVKIPERGKRPERSRHIPQKVRDKVFTRDEGRCTYVSPGGRRCPSTWDLEIDHIVPFARGGDSSESNLRLLCSRHNRQEARKAFGEEHMEKFLKEGRGRYICYRTSSIFPVRDSTPAVTL